MRIHLLSDIHLEFGKFKHSPPECDVVVLSGDIGVGLQAFPWIERHLSDFDVVYVAGNHEFYGRNLDEHIGAMREKAQGTNVRFLYNESVVIQGVRFIGTTLWTDFNLFGRQPLDILAAQDGMTDYERIRIRDRVALTAEHILREHMVCRFYLTGELSKPFDGKTVVVGHHAPSSLSVPSIYEDDPLTAAYASRLEDIMLDFSPVLWTHGHTHDNFDYEIGDTRVVCNPRGYVGHELNPNFNPQLVVTI